MHWPMAFQEGGALMPFNACGRLNFSKVDYLDTWKEMATLVEKGYTKAIGVANFNSDQLERIMDNSDEHPVVNQIECHPFLTQCQLMDFCEENDIAIMAHSPLGSPQRPGAPEDDEKLLENKTVSYLNCFRNSKKRCDIFLLFDSWKNYRIHTRRHRHKY